MPIRSCTLLCRVFYLQQSCTNKCYNSIKGHVLAAREMGNHGKQTSQVSHQLLPQSQAEAREHVPTLENCGCQRPVLVRQGSATRLSQRPNLGEELQRLPEPPRAACRWPCGCPTHGPFAHLEVTYHFSRALPHIPWCLPSSTLLVPWKAFCGNVLILLMGLLKVLDSSQPKYQLSQ